MPITPLSGVRISWLMLARNSDLAREASIACWRAWRRSVMSVPAATTCAIAPPWSSRHVFHHAISRCSPFAAIHSMSNAIGKSAGLAFANVRATTSRSCSATSSVGRCPRTSASARPVSCSQARLKRSIRPWASSTITRLPAVSTTASENVPAWRTRATSAWIERPVSAPTVTNSSDVRHAVSG